MYLSRVVKHQVFQQKNLKFTCSHAFLLHREKSEKRCLNPSAPPPVTSSGVARVPPTSHVGPVQTVRGTHAAGG